MKKARVTSIIARVLFILALVCETIAETVYYVLLFNSGTADHIVIVRDALTYVLPMLSGLLMIIIGVGYHARGRDRVVYSSGFLIMLIIPASLIFLRCFSESPGSGSLTNSFGNEMLLPVAMAAALLLVALDGLICPRLRLMGIFGGALLLYTINAAKGASSGDNWMLFSAFKSYAGLMHLLYWMTIIAGFTFLAIGALVYAIGRPYQKTDQ